MIFKRENYSEELIAEMFPLWKAHHDERVNKFYGPLDPDFAVYEQLDLAGRLRIYTVVQGGKLAGYQIFIVTEHPHSRDWISATQDVLYLKPEFRKGFTGYKFIKWCTKQLQEEGINVVHQVVPYKMNMGRLFWRLGYELEDVCYSKILQEVS